MRAAGGLFLRSATRCFGPTSENLDVLKATTAKRGFKAKPRFTFCRKITLLIGPLDADKNTKIH